MSDSNDQNGRLLLVDDNPTNLQVLFQTLSGSGYELLIAQSGAEALKVAESTHPDMVLLDIMMPPGIDGYETCKQLKANDATREASVIFMSALDDIKDKVRGLELGAVDYITKPFQAEEVIARVSTHLTIHHLRKELAARNLELEAANRRMQHDLVAAARVQQSLLPSSEPELDGMTFAWRYEPCEELAGDLLNVVPIDDHRAAFYIVDVSGHGAASSLVGVSVHRSLSLHSGNSLIARPGADGALEPVAPDQVAEELNAIYPMSANAGLYFTLVYGVVDARSRTVDLCCAGHPSPLHINRGAGARSYEVAAFPVGIVPEPEYEVMTLELEPGDRLILYSDGLTEALNADRDMLGPDRMGKAVSEARDGSLGDALDAAIATAKAWQGGGHFDDDISLVAVEV